MSGRNNFNLGQVPSDPEPGWENNHDFAHIPDGNDLDFEKFMNDDTGSEPDFNMDSYPNLENFDDVVVSGDDDQARPVEPVTSLPQQTPATPAGVNDHSVSPSYPPTQLSAFAVPIPHPTFPATTAAGQYPSLPGLQPDGVLGARNLALLRQQQAFQLAGATANHMLGSAQPLPTGNGILDPRLRGGAPDAEFIGGHTSFSGHANADGAAGVVPPATAPAKPEGHFAPRATPGAQRTIAPKPQSSSRVTNAATQASNNGTTPATVVVLPVKKRAATAKKEPVDTKKTATKESTSKAKQEAVKIPIYMATLLVPTLANAKEVAVKRVALNVVDDDREEVRANYDTWIPLITKAFDAGFRAEPEDSEKFTEEGKKEFIRWQSEHENKVYAIFAEHEAVPNTSAAKYAQACAWFFFNLVLKSHTKGRMVHVPSTIIAGVEDTTMKCSTRILVAIKALEEYPIVRYDLLKRERLEGLAASPAGCVRRKVENMFVNYKKKKGSGPVRFEKEDSKKSKAAKKRKAPSPDLGDDESDGSPDDGDVVQPAKRINTGPKRVDSADFSQ